MRSPRLIYLAVAAVLVVAAFALTDYIADRSAPGLGDEVIIPVGSTSSPTPSTPPSAVPSPTPTPTAVLTPTPTAGPTPTRRVTEALPVSPQPVPTAGDDDDDGIDD
ncbi:MAG: hypothetical protein ACRDPR_20605, partial [Nocardioidaceae bacterium]